MTCVLAGIPPFASPQVFRLVREDSNYSLRSIARKILTRRAELSLSQRDLAKLAGVRVESLYRIETGKATPTVAMIERIDRALTKAETPPKSCRRSGRPAPFADRGIGPRATAGNRDGRSADCLTACLTVLLPGNGRKTGHSGAPQCREGRRFG